MARKPFEVDNRANFVNAPMSQGTYAWWTGAGDNLSPAGPTSGRGDGDQMKLSFTEPATKTRILALHDYAEIFDGEAWWTGTWTNDDRWSIYVFIPKNQSHTEDRTGTLDGNCNVVDTGQGFSILVPAPGGDGAYEVDLAKVSPLPAAGSGMHFWGVEDFKEGTPTAAISNVGAPEGTHALLYDLGWRVYFCKNMSCGSPRGIFEVDSDKAEPIHKNWKIVCTVERASAGNADFGWWFKLFRMNVDEPDIPPTE